MALVPLTLTAGSCFAFTLTVFFLRERASRDARRAPRPAIRN